MVGSVFAKELSTNYFSIIVDYLSASNGSSKMQKFQNFKISPNSNNHQYNILSHKYSQLNNSLATSVSVFDSSRLLDFYLFLSRSSLKGWRKQKILLISVKSSKINHKKSLWFSQNEFYPCCNNICTFSCWYNC